MAEIETVVEPDGVGNDIGWGAPGRNRWRLYVFMGQFYRNQPVKLSVPGDGANQYVFWVPSTGAARR